MPTPLISFDTVEAMLSHPDVKSLIEARVKERIKEPATVHEVVLSASMDIVKEREDVKVLLAREPREVVVKSLNLEELDVALSANAELRERAAQTVEKLRKDTEHFTGQVREICLAEGLSAEQTNTVLATHDFSHRDPEKVKALVRTVKVNLSAGSTAGRGLSAKDEEVLPSFSPKPRTVEDVSRELDYCRRG